MTSKRSQNLRIEAEIAKNREDGNWSKVIELADQLKVLYPSDECLANFLSGEGRLEKFLEQTPPIDDNVGKARAGLVETKQYLLLAANEKDKQAVVVLDAHLLLGKLHYTMGMYNEALYHYEQAELDTLTEKQLPSRSMRIVAESYAIKGLCLEKQPPSSKTKYKIAEWQDKLIKCYEIASDLTLVYLQEQDKQILHQNGTTGTGTGTGTFNPNTSGSSHSTSNEAKYIGPILETALYRAPLLHIQNKNMKIAVNRYREILSAVETISTQRLRKILTRQFAEVLTRNVTGSLYESPEISLNSPGNRKMNQVNAYSGKSDSPWKPKKYMGPNIFIPRNRYEETILLLLISEAMAVRDAVLSQSPEFKEARIRAFENAAAVYDLLTVVLVRWEQVEILHESFERAMKFSHGEVHIWLQFALCLMNLGRHVHAYAVLEIVCNLAPNKVMPCLLAARICYEELNMIEKGIKWSQQALHRDSGNTQGLLSRCHLYIGIGHSIMAVNTTVKQDKAHHVTVAFDSFHKAQQIDPNDHLIEYYLAHLHSMNKQMNEAMVHVKIALNLRAEHIPSLNLLILLLTAQKQFAEALQLLTSILEEYPDNLNFLYVKARLELQVVGEENSLMTIKNMLYKWKTLYETQTTSDNSDQHSDKRSETRSVFQLYTSEMSDKDSNSLHTHSLAVSKVEQALSEVASSLSSFMPKPGPHKLWLLQMQVWILLGEVFLALEQTMGSTLALQEASSIYPLSHQIMFAKGLLHEHKKEFNEGKQWNQNAVAINPLHIKSLQHLGMIYHYLGSQRLAEKVLRDAAQMDPTSHQTWYNLGKVLESLGEVESASNCMATALEVETLNPILPIPAIPLAFE